MIPDQTFHCPHCGAPGQTKSGKAEYSCECRMGHLFTPAPQLPAATPLCPYPWTPPHWPVTY